jgi:formate hydrogenlyase transcriptional activator
MKVPTAEPRRGRQSDDISSLGADAGAKMAMPFDQRQSIRSALLREENDQEAPMPPTSTRAKIVPMDNPQISSVDAISRPLLRRYETLLEVAGSLASTQDLSELFRELLGRIQDFGKFDFLALLLHDPVENVMHLHALHAAVPITVPVSPQIPVAESFDGWVWQNQEPLVIADLGTENRFPKHLETIRGNGIRTFCSLPVTTARKAFGAFSFGSREPNAYTESELKFMEQLATQLALAVEATSAQATAKTYEERLARELQRVRLVHDITNTLVRRLEPQDLFQEVSKCIAQVMPSDYCRLALYDPAKNQFRLLPLDCAAKQDAEEILIPVEGSPWGRALATSNPILVNRLNLGDYPHGVQLMGGGIKSGCWLPLVNRERYLGVLSVCSSREAAFTQEDMALLTDVAHQIAIALDNALAFREIAELKDRLAEEKIYLEEEIRTEHNFEEIVGNSPAIKHVLQEIEIVAKTDSTVMILGETGTGKELVARAIHNLSNRRGRALVKLNCAAIPTGLLESELFGHEKGAFTGAIAQKIGRVELANKGTLFLDEVGDISLELQPKLLRVLQEQEFERLGSTRTIQVDARLIVATNRDLEAMMKQRTFRQDLYYRLNIFPIQVPPLRERPGDIPLLVNFFVNKHSKRIGKHIEKISTQAMRALSSWHWPGNVRELENVIERALILSQGTTLNVPVGELKSHNAAPMVRESVSTFAASEREIILRALREADGVVAIAAGKLGIKRTTLNSKMRKLEISRRDLFAN